VKLTNLIQYLVFYFNSCSYLCDYLNLHHHLDLRKKHMCNKHLCCWPTKSPCMQALQNISELPPPPPPHFELRGRESPGLTGYKKEPASFLCTQSLVCRGTGHISQHEGDISPRSFPWYVTLMVQYIIKFSPYR
jgi:hypothetical protein